MGKKVNFSLTVQGEFKKGNKIPATMVLSGALRECFVGHISLPQKPRGRREDEPRSAAVIACYNLMLSRSSKKGVFKNTAALDLAAVELGFASGREVRRALKKANTVIEYKYSLIVGGGINGEGALSMLFEGPESPIVGTDHTTLKGTGWLWQPCATSASKADRRASVASHGEIQIAP